MAKTETVYNYDIDDIDYVLTLLNTALEETEEFIANQEQIMDEHAQEFEGLFKTALEETTEQNIENGNVLLDFLENLKDAVQSYHDIMQEHVEGFTGEKVEIDIVKVEDTVKRVQEIIEDQSNYNDIVKEKNSFDVWETTLWADVINFSEEEKAEKKAYQINRLALDGLNDYLHSRYRAIEEDLDDLLTKYHTSFEPLSNNDWIDGLIEDLELKDFKFSDFKSITLVDNMIDNYKDNKNMLKEMSKLDKELKNKLREITGFSVEQIDRLYNIFKDLGLSTEDISKIISFLSDLSDNKALNTLENYEWLIKQLDLLEVGIIGAKVGMIIIMYTLDIDIDYMFAKNTFSDFCSWLGGEIGEKIALILAAPIYPPLGPALAKPLGDMIGSKIAEVGAENFFDIIFSVGGNDRLVVDYEVIEFIENCNSGSYDDVGVAMEAFGDILND